MVVRPFGKETPQAPTGIGGLPLRPRGPGRPGGSRWSQSHGGGQLGWQYQGLGETAEGGNWWVSFWNLKGTSHSSPRKDGLGLGGEKGPLSSLWGGEKYHPKLTGSVRLFRKNYGGLVAPPLLMHYCMNFYVYKTIWLPYDIGGAIWSRGGCIFLLDEELKKFTGYINTTR